MLSTWQAAPSPERHRDAYADLPWPEGFSDPTELHFDARSCLLCWFESETLVTEHRHQPDDRLDVLAEVKDAFERDGFEVVADPSVTPEARETRTEPLLAMLDAVLGGERDPSASSLVMSRGREKMLVLLWVEASTDDLAASVEHGYR